MRCLENRYSYIKKIKNNINLSIFMRYVTIKIILGKNKTSNISLMIKIDIWSQLNGCFRSGEIWVLDAIIDSFLFYKHDIWSTYFDVDMSLQICSKTKCCFKKLI